MQTMKFEGSITIDNDIVTVGDWKPIAISTSPCDLCVNLEEGDTLYISSDWDGGLGFDYIRDIKYCPKCGRKLGGN